MKSIESDYPLSIFREALISVPGRVLGFFVVVIAGHVATLLGLGLRLQELEAWMVLWVPCVLVGCFQGWGLVAYVVLAVVFVVHVHYEKPPGITLSLAFLLQAAETFRCVIQPRGWDELSPLRIAAFSVAWVSLAVLFSCLTFLRHRAQPEAPSASPPASSREPSSPPEADPGRSTSD